MERVYTNKTPVEMKVLMLKTSKFFQWSNILSTCGVKGRRTVSLVKKNDEYLNDMECIAVNNFLKNWLSQTPYCDEDTEDEELNSMAKVVNMIGRLLESNVNDILSSND